jgi:hypothetical protein
LRCCFGNFGLFGPRSDELGATHDDDDDYESDTEQSAESKVKQPLFIAYFRSAALIPTRNTETKQKSRNTLRSHVRRPSLPR